jgi:glycosyltransferase involved in cell wall biosynthesis
MADTPARQPLVTVVVPTLNREHLLAKTLESIFGQDYANLEVIVIDAGGKDGTQAVLDSYGDRLTWR